MLPQTRFPPVRKIQHHSGHTIKCLLSDSTSSPGSSPTNLSLCRDESERTLVTKKSEVGPEGKIFGCWSGQYFSVRPSNSVIKYRLMHPCMVDPTMKMPPIQQHMPISLYVGNTHNWPRPRGQLFSCINDARFALQCKSVFFDLF